MTTDVQPSFSISLPEGSQRDFNQSVTAAEIATYIGSGLARQAIAAKRMVS